MDGTRARTGAQRAGDAAESHVASRLKAAGWTILGRNIRVGRAEIDLLAVDPGPPRTLVVLEVRFRSRREFGLGEETITRRKRILLRAALATLRDAGTLPTGHALPHLASRFDLVIVEPAPRPGDPTRVRHHPHAF